MDIHQIAGVSLIIIAIISMLFTWLVFGKKLKLTDSQKTFYHAIYISDFAIMLLGIAIYLGYIFK